MREIIWSNDAKLDYDNNIIFLLEKWSIIEAQEFVDEVAAILKTLPMLPEMFPPIGYRDLHKGVICKQITLLYRVNANTIELVRFWNNNQDPGKLKLVK